MKLPGLRMAVRAATLTVFIANSSFTQAQNEPSPGLALLQRVSQHYADARSYYIESSEVRLTSGEYDQASEKTLLTAAEAPGDRFYFEGRGKTGSSVKASDGMQVWVYHVNEHHYTVTPKTSVVVSPNAITPLSELGLLNAQSMRKQLADTANHLKSAALLPDETIEVNGRKMNCYVVRVQTSDDKRAQSNYPFDRTIWIDKSHETIVKIAENAQRYIMAGSANLPMTEVSTTLFNKVELDTPLPASLFTFVPPAEAKLIADFPDPRNEMMGANLMGETIPPLKFKTADGKVLSIEKYRGKPVLLDFWATWCGPCVAALPKLAALNQQAKGTGLTLISVDQDEDPAKATAFFSKKGYTWPDFHDSDGAIENQMGASGIPRTVLVDAKGQIAYDAAGFDDDRLRSAIAKLGPEYAALAAKPKTVPCTASP